MQMPSQGELLAAIDAFLERHPAIGEARFGRDATGEPGLVGRLRNGSSPTLRIAERIVTYMACKDRGTGYHGGTNADGTADHEVTTVSDQVPA